MAVITPQMVLRADISNPHRLHDPAVNNEFCQHCHAGPLNRTEPTNRHPMTFRQDPISMCTDCHSDNASSHSVDIAVDFTVPPDLPLSASGKITCLTCHKAHGRQHSNRPWASVSFIDRLVNSERLTKTYLLRRNNANGELCLVCHDPEEKHNHE
ncbi:cytochrome c3 family protein [methane-oxidizing endosymbiont of Gigantopelta aegis]|uniref:cytochrome c3 family protein n=1 Tax=methane-oxidizing endosymbiont of Gigantopelta aegis TaxID=2794938 RepID=UPI0018DB536E|nr:cytochrome c3 family protein [methane-oxidizing endosymbiont of Gigantopelta aegis]